MRRIILEVTKESEPPVSVGDGSFVKRVVINTRRWPRYFSVISGRVKIQDSKTSLEKVYTGYERLALNAVFVQVIRMPIRRSNEDYSVRH